MLRYYILIAARNLKKNKWVSLINISGLGLALAICLSILQFYLQEISFNRYHENADRIYKISDANISFDKVDYRVKDQLLSNFAEIENVCISQVMTDNIEINTMEITLNTLLYELVLK